MGDWDWGHVEVIYDISEMSTMSMSTMSTISMSMITMSMSGRGGEKDGTEEKEGIFGIGNDDDDEVLADLKNTVKVW